MEWHDVRHDRWFARRLPPVWTVDERKLICLLKLLQFRYQLRGWMSSKRISWTTKNLKSISRDFASLWSRGSQGRGEGRPHLQPRAAFSSPIFRTFLLFLDEQIWRSCNRGGGGGGLCNRSGLRFPQLPLPVITNRNTNNQMKKSKLKSINGNTQMHEDHMLSSLPIDELYHTHFCRISSSLFL